MVRPVSASIPVSFAYGIKYKNGVIHKGVDFSKGTEGNPVYAIVGGVVSHAGYGGWGPAYGQHVIIKSTVGGKTKWTLYGHLKSMSVIAGQSVTAGIQVGKNGGAAGKRYSGNSTGPHVHVQVGHANVYTAYEDPWPLINSGGTVKKPAPVEPWFSLTEYNLAGFDKVHGKATWDTRVDELVKNIAAIGSHIFAILELPDGKVSTFKAKLKAAGYTLGPGTDGRYVVVRAGIKIGRHALYTMPDRGPANDDKQAVYVEVFPTNDNAVLVGTTQLEYRDGAKYDNTRVTQAKQFLAHGNDLGDQWEIPSSRRFWPLDENSDSRVAKEAFGSSWPDGADVAGKKTNTVFATFQGWVKKLRKAAPIDKIHVHKSRPVISVRVETQTIDDSDHIAKTIRVGSL